MRKLESAQRRAYLARHPLPSAWIGRKEAAAQLGISLRLLDSWRARKFGPPCARVGRFVLYPVESVLVFASFLGRKVKGHPIQLDLARPLPDPNAWADWMPPTPTANDAVSVPLPAAQGSDDTSTGQKRQEDTSRLHDDTSGRKTKTERTSPGRGFGPGVKGRQMREQLKQEDVERAQRMSIWEACGKSCDRPPAPDPLAIVRRTF
jgi:hypothetical protein